MISTKYRLLLLATLFTACRSAAPGTRPEPDIDSRLPGSAPVKSEIASWTISPTSKVHRYTSVTNAALELLDSTTTSRDTVISTVSFSLAVSRNATPASYSALVESIATTTGFKTGGTAASSRISLPFAFSGRFEPGRITLDFPKAQTEVSIDCANEVFSAVPVVQRSLILIPLQLSSGMTWTDSAVASICSGPLLVSLTSVRIYHVRGQAKINDHPAILLDQESRTSFNGEGAQNQHRIRVQGNGSGTTQLTVDTETGALIDAAGSHTTAIIVTSSGRNQRFTQTAREWLTRIE